MPVQSGDISDQSSPRLIYVFDHTIGTLTPTAAKKRAFHLRLHQWKRAAHCWEIDPHVVKVIIDIQYRTSYNVDLATYVDPDEAEHIEDRLGGVGLPYGNFFVTTIEEMTRVIVNRPNVAAVFDYDPARQFTYGSKSRSVAGL
jgi:hypothetical protein